MGKVKLLSVEEVGNFESEKEYYVESDSPTIPNGIYKYSDCYLSDKADNSFYRRCINVEQATTKVYEYEEEITIKEYKGWEILKMIDEGELSHNDKVIVNDTFELYVSITGTLRYSSNRDEVDSSYFNNINKYTIVELKPVEVIFMEAVKAYQNGKTIQCEDDEKDITTYCKTTRVIGMRDDEGVCFNC